MHRWGPRGPSAAEAGTRSWAEEDWGQDDDDNDDGDDDDDNDDDDVSQQVNFNIPHSRILPIILG